MSLFIWINNLPGMIMIAVGQSAPKPRKHVPPLENGDHLDQATFHQRYEAMPGVRAELIGGIVYMSSPQKIRHGFHQRKLSRLVDEYVEATPGTEGCVNTTSILGPDAEPQPDTCLLILPEYGGQAAVDENDYLAGAPEWVGEISDSTESIDLNRKKVDYEKAGVRECMVVAVRTQQLFWFIRRRGKFKPLAAGKDGIFRSETFPGFWLDAAALLQRDGQRLLAILYQELASPEHESFVEKLARKKGRPT
jgi:Uma2 family endonuclease